MMSSYIMHMYISSIVKRNLKLTDKEIYLGYIAHLIEDLIWFRKYLPTYVNKMKNDKCIYLMDDSIHADEEIRKDIYFDYSNSSQYVVSICKVNVQELIENIANIINNKEHIKVILELIGE